MLRRSRGTQYKVKKAAACSVGKERKRTDKDDKQDSVIERQTGSEFPAMLNTPERQSLIQPAENTLLSAEISNYPEYSLAEKYKERR